MCGPAVRCSRIRYRARATRSARTRQPIPDRYPDVRYDGPREGTGRARLGAVPSYLLSMTAFMIAWAIGAARPPPETLSRLALLSSTTTATATGEPLSVFAYEMNQA